MWLNLFKNSEISWGTVSVSNSFQLEPFRVNRVLCTHLGPTNVIATRKPIIFKPVHFLGGDVKDLERRKNHIWVGRATKWCAHYDYAF